jgi:hypothetical protein
MKSGIFSFLTKPSLIVVACLFFTGVRAQNQDDFWQHVRFGGAFGASFGSGYTNLMLSPGAIYQFNEYIGLGASLTGSYVDQDDWYQSWMYGGSIIVLGNPIPEVQLSVELEQLRVNLDYDAQYADFYNIPKQQDFWSTGLFVGAGYSTGPVTVGLRYNVLFNANDNVYSDAWMPFIRAYF